MKALLLPVAMVLLALAGRANAYEPNGRPIDFRLNYLASALACYADGKPMWENFLGSPDGIYIFTWIKAVEVSPPKKAASMDSVIKTADTFLRKRLPENMFSKPSRILSAGRYRLDGTKPTYIWVVEFDVHDYSPMAGAGWGPTLFVPLDERGNLLVKLEARNVPKQ